MRKYGLDVANIPVKNQHQSWDETGMWFRQWNEQKNDFDPEQIKIITTKLYFPMMVSRVQKWLSVRYPLIKMVILFMP